MKPNGDIRPAADDEAARYAAFLLDQVRADIGPRIEQWRARRRRRSRVAAIVGLNVAMWAAFYFAAGSLGLVSAMMGTSTSLLVFGLVLVWDRK